MWERIQKALRWSFFSAGLLTLAASPVFGSEVLGEIHLVGGSRVEELGGVWVDGQYVGYLKELKGSKKLLLLPGEHEIKVRYAGYEDFVQKLTVEPGRRHVVRVDLEADPDARYPEVTAEVKLSISPNRAAVFLGGAFVGHVDEFDGPGQALLVAPGKHILRVALPGYHPFQTEVQLVEDQKFELKTNLVPSNGQSRR